MSDDRVRLFVFDFDGTALGGHEPYDQFPKPFARFLDLLTANGIGWATNTTWSPDKQLDVARRSGVKSDPALLTGQTGRVIATVAGGRLVPNYTHEKQVIAREKRFKRKNWPVVRPIFIKLLQEDLVHRIAYDFYGQNAIAFSCRPADADRVWQELEPLVASGEYYIWDPQRGPTNMLLMKTMNKGEPLKLMRERFGLAPGQILVAGDETNDLHMFDPDLARWMVCPANAHTLVKERVRQHDGVVGPKDFSWGVIEAAQEVFARIGQPLRTRRRV